MFSSPWIPFLLFVLSTSVVTALPYRFPRLSPIGEKFLHHSRVLLEAPPSDDFKTFYYNQTLDHFNYRPESYTTFPQRYIVNFKYWGGANSSAPIFAYLGAEAPIDDDLNVIGFMTDNAIQFNALLVYIEVKFNVMLVVGLSRYSFSVSKVVCHCNSIVTTENRYHLDQGMKH